VKLYGMTAIEREQMGLQGQAYFRTYFDHDHLVEQLINHFDNVAQQRGNA
jgi:hypothetical protein